MEKSASYGIDEINYNQYKKRKKSKLLIIFLMLKNIILNQ